jgi:hypothetical protein
MPVATQRSHLRTHASREARAGHLRTAPTLRRHAGTCGVGVSPTGASDRSPPASPPPTGPAVLTAHEARERGGGHAAAHRSVLARSVIAPYTRVTPIQFPIRARWRGRLRASAPLCIMRHTRSGGRACIDGRWECCQVLRWP